MNLLFAIAILAVLASVFLGLDRARSKTALLRSRAPPPPLPSAAELPGGDPGRAILVRSPAVIENHAERWPCPVCASPVRCEHHRVMHLGERRLRVARVRCPRCGFERDVHFELRASELPS